MRDKKTERFIFLIAILWYSITAYFSSGYYHADEHYQIIEFARLKSGANLPADMPWEFHEQIRSAIQPAISFILLKIFNLFSLTNPYSQAFLLRLLTAIISVLSISFFCKSCKPMINRNNWNIFYALSFFVWFSPSINVRFSSETYSGLCFILAAALVVRNKHSRYHFMLIGTLCGLSFIFRFQMIAVTFGLIMWLIVVQKEKLLNLLYLLSGFSFILFIGTAIDCWFYNEFVFTPWKYFYANIIKDVASNFGTSPWYYYFYYIFRYSFFPIGIMILLAFIVLINKQPKNIFVWIVLPFLILHSIIPHKELRFLFPIINFVPIFLMLAFQELNSYENLVKGKKIKKLMYLIITALCFINAAGLLAASIKPAGIGNMKITQEIQKNNNCESTVLISYNGSNPYDPWNGLIAKFYMKKNCTAIDLGDANNDSTQTECTFLVLKMKDLENPVAEDFIKKQNMEKISESIPNWISRILIIYGGFDTQNILVLFKKKAGQQKKSNGIEVY